MAREEFSFSIGAQIGGLDAANATDNVMSHLRTALKTNRPPPSNAIIDFTFLLRVDGEIQVFKFEGCEPARINRKKRYVSVDIGISKRIWSSSQTVFKRYLCNCLREAVAMMLIKVQKYSIPIDEKAVTAELEKSLKQFLSRPSTDKDNFFEKVPMF